MASSLPVVPIRDITKTSIDFVRIILSPARNRAMDLFNGNRCSKITLVYNSAVRKWVKIKQGKDKAPNLLFTGQKLNISSPPP